MNASIVKEKWEAIKPSLKGLFSGLIFGPIIFLWIGWTIPTYTVQGKVNAAIVKLKTSICVARARGAVKDTTKLEWGERTKLARKWGTMPGEKEDSSGSDVTIPCADELAEAPKDTSS